MERSDRCVSWLGVGIAFLIPLAVAGLVAILVARGGPQEVRLIGVPRDQLQSLETASEGEAVISAEAATKIARGGMRGSSHGRVRDIALGRYRDDAPDYFQGHLVWVISFAPDELAPVFVSGGVGSDHSCDWAYHYDFAVAAVNAHNGEWQWGSNGSFFDPSLPPTYGSPSNSDREDCERLYGER